MNGKLTLTQIRVILLLVAVLLVVLTYFLIYQGNMEKAADYDKKTTESNERVAYLEGLKAKVSNLETLTSLYEDDMNDFIQSFPVKITQQKSVYLVYRLMINAGIDVQSISPGEPTRFYYKGQVLRNNATAIEEESSGEDEMSEITVVDMEQMIGSMATYQVNLSGTTKQIYKALDWISESEEKLSVGDVSLQFDKSTGKLSGSIGMNFYSMLGNGVPYKDPDMSEFTYGVDSVFGDFTE